MKNLLIISAAVIGFAANALAVTVNLSTITSNTTLADGDTATGTLGGNYKVSIADGATVTLDGVTINGVHNSSYKWAGITCEGNATIILVGSNAVKGFYEDYPGIQACDGKTLTIKGNGSLTASSTSSNNGNGWGAGIGGGYYISCGNIVIESGTINARGGQNAAGIGVGRGASCGDILITGGNITATGGSYAAGIGSGKSGSCGIIAIGSGVTRISATRGSATAKAIGAGEESTCDTVTVAGGMMTDLTEGQTRTIEGWTGIFDLGNLTLGDLTDGGRTFASGSVLTGTLGVNARIIIADGATVKLRNVIINGGNDSNYMWAGITCEGDATIVLEGNNTVKGFYAETPGIKAASGKTLRIKGNGSLTAEGKNYGAGIGAGRLDTCGDIVIEGGTITATGGSMAAGIGGGYDAECGDILITGGNITANGGGGGAGIGCGFRDMYASCGRIDIDGGTVTATGGSGACGIGHGSGNISLDPNNTATITITKGVTLVTSTKGNNAGANIANSGAVTIGEKVGIVTDSPFVYPNVNLANQSSDYTAQDGDAIVGETVHKVTVPSGASVMVNGVKVEGGVPAAVTPEFSVGGEAVTTKFTQGTGNTWTLTAWGEIDNDASGRAVTDSRIKVYRGNDVNNISTLVTPTEMTKKSAVKVEMTVETPVAAPKQFFKVEFE